MATIPVQDHMVRAFADAADEVRTIHARRVALGLGVDRQRSHVESYLEGVADALRYLVGDLEINADHTILSSVNDYYHEGL